ncbi:MAG: hypothetical protein R3B13_06255 [Polyangiaceae bacterium]
MITLIGFMAEAGYLTLFRLRGVPLRLHWTLPLGMLVFGGLRVAPAFWLGFFVLVLLHELGHAFIVRAYGHRVLSVDVTGFGGLCRWSGSATAMERGLIAWGGVLAQAVLLAVALGITLSVGAPKALWARELLSVFTWTNVWIIGLNLLPVPPLDGAEAWGFVRNLLRGAGFPRPVKRIRVTQGDGNADAPHVDAVAWKPPKGDPRFSRPMRQVWTRYRDSERPPPARENESSPKGGTSNEDLARMLRKIGDDAGRARR